MEFNIFLPSTNAEKKTFLIQIQKISGSNFKTSNPAFSVI